MYLNKKNQALSFDPFDVSVGASIRVILRKYSDMTVLNESDKYQSSVWPVADQNAIDSFFAVINKAVFFTQGKMIPYIFFNRYHVLYLQKYKRYEI